MTLRALVVDDEVLARRRIVRLLHRESDVEVVGVCASGGEALDAVRTLSPDLLLLDVQMPGLTGLEVARALDAEPPPCVVFVTAFDQYALEAFEVRAIDYVLKPFKHVRLREAVQRARTRAAHDRAAFARQVESLPDAPRRADAAPLPEPDAGGEPAAAPLSRLLVKENHKLFFVRTDEVDWFEAEANYVRLHVGARSYLVRGKLARLEDRLCPDRFVRIHRSTIVNVDRIRELYPWFGGDFIVVMKDGMELRLSRHYRARLVRRLE